MHEVNESARAVMVASAHCEMSDQQLAGQHEAVFLNCSRCGLSIRVRFASLEVEHCPRCLVRARLLQPLFRSPLPLTTLCGSECEPELESQVDAPQAVEQPQHQRFSASRRSASGSVVG